MKKLLTVIFIICMLTGCSNLSQSKQGKTPSSPVVEATQEDNSEDILKCTAAKVTKVVDGDTVHILLKGNDNKGERTEKVRLIGANAPELDHPETSIKEQPFGEEAKKYTTEKLLGKTVYITLDVSQYDKYKRLLAYVWIDKPKSDDEKEIRNKLFNAQLLLSGYSQCMTVPPNVKYSKLFVQFEKEARESKKGLWNSNTEKPNDRYKKK